MAAPCALLLLEKTLVLLAEVDFAATLVTLDDVVTGQETVHGIALVNGKLVTLVADAKTGAWEAIAGFGRAPGPCGFRTLSITCKTPLAIRMSACNSCALLM